MVKKQPKPINVEQPRIINPEDISSKIIGLEREISEITSVYTILEKDYQILLGGYNSLNDQYRQMNKRLKNIETAISFSINDVEDEPIHESEKNEYSSNRMSKFAPYLKAAGIGLTTLAFGTLVYLTTFNSTPKEQKPVKIKENIVLTEKCPHMYSIYNNQSNNDAFINNLNLKGTKDKVVLIIDYVEKGYMTINSETVCKEGIWDERIYLINQDHTNKVINSVIDSSQKTIADSIAFRNSLKSKLTTNIAKSNKATSKQSKKDIEKKASKKLKSIDDFDPTQ